MSAHRRLLVEQRQDQVEKEWQAGCERAHQVQRLEGEFAAHPPEKRVEAAAFHVPLAYRVEQSYTYLGNQGRAYEQTDRPRPGHTRSTYLEDSRVRAAQWLGHRAAPETGLRRRPVCQRRVALPCPAQAGAGGLDYCRMETKRE